MALTIRNGDLETKHKIDLLSVLMVVTSKPAHHLFYVLAIAMLHAVPIGNLPLNFVALATVLEVNSLSSILEFNSFLALGHA